MKKHLSIVLISIVLLFNSCHKDYSSTDYLATVLAKLEKIESATYTLKQEHWLPGDTASSSSSFSFLKEYNNASDSTIGAKYVRLSEDSTTLKYCYDGQMRAIVYSDERRVVLDSFIINPLPFRPVNPPFFNHAKNILKYSLETGDSISLLISDHKDYVHVKLAIHEDMKVEFFGKAFHMPPNPYDFGDNTSIYELWIDKTNKLPYKVRREMSHGTVERTCLNFQLNNLDIKEFRASDYFPADYELKAYRTGRKKIKPHNLIGKEAPDWTLMTGDKLQVSLTDLKSKVSMIQFTSVSCGPCMLSIPFLNELSKQYTKDEFDFAAIECTSSNTNVLNNYAGRTGIEYKFLLSNSEVRSAYSISSYPVFFILDEHKVIRHVIKGYRKGSTDKELRGLINDLI